MQQSMLLQRWYSMVSWRAAECVEKCDAEPQHERVVKTHRPQPHVWTSYKQLCPLWLLFNKWSLQLMLINHSFLQCKPITFAMSFLLQTYQVLKEPFQLFGFILQTESHPLPHLGWRANDPSPHDGSDVLHQDSPVHLTHQRLSVIYRINDKQLQYY